MREIRRPGAARVRRPPLPSRSRGGSKNVGPSGGLDSAPTIIVGFPHFFGLRYRQVAVGAVTAVLIAGGIVYWISRIAKALTMAGVPNCPRCGLMHTSQPAARSAADWLFRLFGCSPYKCAVCRKRFYRPD